MKKILYYTGLVLAFFLVACSSDKKTGEEGVSTVLPDEIATVKAVKLESADFEQEIIANGTVQAAEKADLRFFTSENITKIYVKNGDHVVRGQKIAELDQFKLKNSLKVAEDNLSRSRLELHDVLIGQGYSLNDTADIPEDVYAIARVKSNYDQNLSQYELAKYNWQNSTLYAPFDGIVANLFTLQHNQAPTSEAFCTIVNNQQLEVLFMILENELPLIVKGDKVSVSPYAINDYTVQGDIIEINPIVNKNGMVRVKARVKGKQSKLYDGMHVKVKVQRTVPNQLVIPKEALVLRTNKKVVFTYQEGKAIWNYVTTGLENSTGYIVLDGLKEGDMVIYQGNINLAHETPVELVQ